LLFDFLCRRFSLRLVRRSAVATATLLCTAFALTGCVTAPEQPQAPASVPAATQTVYVPVYVEVEKAVAPAPAATAPEPIKLPEDQEQSLALLSEIAKSSNSNGEELRKEYASAQATFNRDKTLINRMRFTWYSALLAPTQSDDAKLTALIEPMVAKIGGFGATHPLRPIAELLLAQISERARQVREQSKKVDELQQKLDALKAIEKQLLDRERRRN
jgi:hypothetical protein